MKLSYIDLVNRFWELDEIHSFSGNETRLYFYLLKVANGLGWPDEFEHDDKKTTGNAGMTLNTLKPCRDRLIGVGLIDFEPGGQGRGDKARYQIRYQILTPKNIERCQKRYQERCQESSQKLTPNSEKVSVMVSKIDTYSYIIENKTTSNDVVVEEKGRINFSEKPTNLPVAQDSQPPNPPPPKSQLDDWMSQVRADGELLKMWSEIFKFPSGQLSELLYLFLGEQIIAKKVHKDFEDFKKHCHYWLRIQFEKPENQRHDNRSSQPNPSSQPGATHQPGLGGEIISPDKYAGITNDYRSRRKPPHGGGSGSGSPGGTKTS